MIECRVAVRRRYRKVDMLFKTLIRILDSRDEESYRLNLIFIRNLAESATIGNIVIHLGVGEKYAQLRLHNYIIYCGGGNADTRRIEYWEQEYV